MSKARVTIWFEEDGLVLSFDHPFEEWRKEDGVEIEEYDGEENGREAIGILEYMGQSDDWSGVFYSHSTVTRVKIEKGRQDEQQVIS